MSDQDQTLPLVHPGEVPPETWLTFSQFAHLMPGMSKRAWEHNVKEGRLPAGTRFSPKGPLVHKAGALAAFFAQRDAEVAQ
jgi:hypothetical protein